MDRGLTACDVMAWAAPSGCDGCGAPLTSRARRWCQSDCGDLYWKNHRYTQARFACLARSVARYRRLRSGRLIPTHWRCRMCGSHTQAPEVNHVKPARGQHSRISCIHHRENLEVLCRACHRTETRRQHAAGELKRAA